MKTKRTLLIAIAVVSTFIYSHAQTVNKKDKFVLSASSTKLEMEQNSEAQILLSILRSERYQNANIALSIPNLPDGMSVEITQSLEDSNLNHLVFTANEYVQAGKYSLSSMAITRHSEKD